MIRSKLVKIISASLLCVCATFSSFAGFWDWTQPYKGPKKDIVTLIITANYRDTLLLAQLAQYHSKQPFVLLPAKGQNQIFFWPARQDTALEIAENDFTRFLSFLNPQRIIVIGSTNVVTEKYINMIPRDITVIVIYNQDWEKVAEALDGYLRSPNISSDFTRLKKSMTTGYVPTQDKKPEVPVKPETNEQEAAVAPTKAATPADASTVKIVTFEGPKKATDSNMPKEAPIMIEAKK